MTAGKCPHCGIDIKNLGAHIPSCKRRQADKLQLQSPILEVQSVSNNEVTQHLEQKQDTTNPKQNDIPLKTEQIKVIEEEIPTPEPPQKFIEAEKIAGMGERAEPQITKIPENALKIEAVSKTNMLQKLNKYRIMRAGLLFLTASLFLITIVYLFELFFLKYPITLMVIPKGMAFMAWSFFCIFVTRIAWLNVKGTVYKSPKSITSDKLNIVTDPYILIQNLPTWSVSERKPMFIFEDEEKEIIQVVLASNNSRWKFIWALWNPTDLVMSIGSQAYEVPNGITSGIFLLNKDTGKPINVDEGSETETKKSVHIEQVKNLYYSKGRIEGAGALQKQLGLIVIIVIFVLLAVCANIYMTYNISSQLDYLNQTVTPALNKYLIGQP